MKKKNVALFALSAAALMGLGSCGEEGASSTEPENPGVALTVDAPEGVDVKVTNTPEGGKYFGGETVNFTVKEDIADKDVSLVKAAGHVVTEEDGVYSFVMPNVDSSIEVELKTLGDADVLKVSDVDEEMIPALAKENYKDPDSIKAFTKAIADVLKGSDALEGDYLRDMSFEMQNSPVGNEFKDAFKNDNSTYQAKGNVYATVDKRLKLELNATTGVGQHTYKYYAENGFNGEDMFYTSKVKYSGLNSSYYGYSVKGEDDAIQLYTVVSDDIEEQEGATYDAKKMMKKADAEKKGTTFGIGELFAKKLYEGTTSTSLSFFGADNKLYNTISEVKKTIAEDKKSYTLEIVSYDISFKDSGTFSRYTNTICVDGDGFARKLYCVVDKLNAADWVEAEEKAAAGAVPTSTSYVKFDLTRGFKHDDIETTKLEDYAMKDYGVQVKLNRSWANTSYVSTLEGPLTMDAGGQIQGVYFLNFGEEKAVITPKFLGTADEGFLGAPDRYGYQEILKAGKTKFVFDNWFGETKEFEVTFTQPDPYKIEASLDKSIVEAGETIKLTTSISPAAATQDLTVTLNPNDKTGSVLTKNDDGTYAIKTKTAGNSFVTITSTVKPEVTKVVAFSVSGPATYANIMETLPTVTFVNKDKSATNHDCLNINFNADGTGAVIASTSSGTNKYGKLCSFTWTLDEETLAFTITQAEAADGNTIVGFTAVNSALYKMSVVCNGKAAVDVELTMAGRVADLATGPWVNVNAL